MAWFAVLVRRAPQSLLLGPFGLEIAASTSQYFWSGPPPCECVSLVPVEVLPITTFQLLYGPLPSVGLRHAFGVTETPWHQSPWELIVGVIVGLATIFLGSRLCTRTAGFLDCACISQTDEEQKKEGVRNLGGFLHVSDELIVLWDEKYFTRGWCVYELAMYKTLRPDGKVKILP